MAQRETLEQIVDDAAALRSLTKGAERTARLVKQLTARVDDNIKTLQSEMEDTSK